MSMNDAAQPATSPARTPRQHTRDAVRLHMIIDEMRAQAPSQLYPLLQVAESMMNGSGDQQ